MPLSRYRSRYSELRPLGTYDTDLATARFGEATVSCWTCEKDRQWGVFGRRKQHAAVMCFQMQALPGSDDCRLSHFELDLCFAPEGRKISATAGHRSNCPATCEDRPEVCLIGSPAPRCVSHEGGAGTSKASCWKFWSSRVSDTVTGQALTARWLWEASDSQELKGRILHGGVAVHHPGDPFIVTCHVKGRVERKDGIRLKFSNQHHEPRPWKLQPEVCDRDLQDLQADIDELEINIMRLNSPESTRECCAISRTSICHADLHEASTSSINQHRHETQTVPTIYGLNLIGGGARVIQGNVEPGAARCLFQPEPM